MDCHVLRRDTAKYPSKIHGSQCGRTPLAHLKGLEPPTHCLEGNCSIQLSYRHK